MSDFRGKFVWYELMTNDMKAAQDFYTAVVGWSAKDAGMPGMAYTLLSAGGTQVAGVMGMPGANGSAQMPPSWSGYVAVDDVDASTAEAKRAGATVLREPTDIPNVGRFSFIADPQGAMIALFRGTSAAPPPQPAPSTPGLIGWRELHAADWEAAWDFYAKLFGWQKDQAMDMGPMGTYQIFKNGSEMLGGMMTKAAVEPHPHWLYYMNVDAIDAAGVRVTKGGGQVLFGPSEVPGGSWILQCRDPQGGVFALVGPRK